MKCQNQKTCGGGRFIAFTGPLRQQKGGLMMTSLLLLGGI